MIQITWPEAISELERIVAAEPEHRVPASELHLYRHPSGDQSPVDLVGRLLAAKGFEDWDAIEGSHWSHVGQRVIKAHLRTHALLYRIQRATDQGKTFKEALESARRWVEKHPDAWSWVDWPAGTSITQEQKEEAIRHAW